MFPQAIFDMEDTTELDPREVDAASHNLNYVQLDGAMAAITTSSIASSITTSYIASNITFTLITNSSITREHRLPG